MKVALVYDRVNKWGGAERVLLTLHKMFPDAPLYTSVYDAKLAPWAGVFPKIYTSFLQRIPFARRHHEWLAIFMPLAFESFNFDGYDVVISVTSEAAKGIITKPETKHICYCLTPTRYLWSGYDDYFKGSTFKGITKPVVSYLRSWDKIAAQRPDIMVAISSCVQDRIKKYYGRSSVVIHPPVSMAKSKNKIVKSKNEDYYLVVSRLVSYKHIDLAVEAFNRLGLPLYIVGTGSEEGRLKKMAKRNIKFLGQLTEHELGGYYEQCRALIHPQEEDFGLSAVEAEMFGKAVIAFKKGGALDSVIHGQTGYLFSDQTAESLFEAVQYFNNHPNGIKAENCRAGAEKFSREKFMEKLKQLVEEAL